MRAAGRGRGWPWTCATPPPSSAPSGCCGSTARRATERDAIAGLYRTADGWVRLHTNFPHHRDGILRLLGCAHERQAVADALRLRRALAFEAEATAAGLCVAALRSFAEWDAHPQGQAVPTRPLVAIERIGEAPARPLPAADRPLAGLRMIELTRVIAGPVCGRTLAAHGAEVLRIIAPHLPTFARLDIDTGRGKRAAQLDLRREADRRALRDLVRGADVFIQGYRPGAIAAFGFGPDALARLRPGIVAVSLSAYGAAGPWAEKRGFDSLVQTASGFNAAEAEAARQETPRALPAQALDFATGHLLAFGAIVGLIWRAEQGGSWHVQASLARTGHWLRGLGRIADGFATPDPTADDFADLMEESDTPFGRVRAVRHPASSRPRLRILRRRRCRSPPTNRCGTRRLIHGRRGLRGRCGTIWRGASSRPAHGGRRTAERRSGSEAVLIWSARPHRKRHVQHCRDRRPSAGPSLRG